jgi:hypothetical protein
MGLTGLEPVTLRLSSACSNQLSYRPALRLRRRIFEFRLPIFDFFFVARVPRNYLNRQSKIANRKLSPNAAALEARGFEPLTSSLQSWRSTN